MSALSRSTFTAAFGLATAGALVLAGCSSSGESADTADGGAVTVVASTNVWASVAEAVAGDNATVTAIITDPSADPHSYEASPSDAAALSEASLVVYNGGGYDSFVDDVLGTGTSVPSIDAYSFLGAAHEDHAGDEHADESHDGHTHGSENEHVWYDPEVAASTAEAIAAELGELDPDNAATYSENAERFHDEVHAVTDVTARIAAEHAGAPVAQTEPIAHYLLEGAEVDDRTPEDFEDAIEEGNDPSPASIAATRDLMTNKQVRALVYNVQTSDSVTESIRTVAEENDIPVVEVTETLPEGMTYIAWQTKAAEDLEAALSS